MTMKIDSTRECIDYEMLYSQYLHGNEEIQKLMLVAYAITLDNNLHYS